MKTSRKIQASRKSKIPKRRMLNASRNRKALKTQKGGSVEIPALTNQETPEMRNARISREKLEKKKYEKEANLTMLEAIKTSPILKEYPAVLALIEKIFAGDNVKYFKLDGAMPDPFIKLADRDDFTPSFYLDWYKSKNPEFKTHKEMKADEIDFNTNIGLDGSGNSIYETVIAQICRDILIMLKTGNRNMNNNARDPKAFFQRLSTNPFFQNKADIMTKALTLLDKQELTNDNKKELNSAKKSLNLQTEKDLVIDEQTLVNFGLILSQCNECISKGYIYSYVFNIMMEYIALLCSGSSDISDFTINQIRKKLENSPFIILPIYMQISYKYVLCLMSAPIVNFRLINRKRAIHGIMSKPCEELNHDILFHAKKTHLFDYFGDYEQIHIWFDNMSGVISTLYPYFNYKKISSIPQTKTDYDKLSDEEKKQIIAIILFIFVHELDSKTGGISPLLFYVYDNYFRIITFEKIFNNINQDDEFPKNIDIITSSAALIEIFIKEKTKLNSYMRNLSTILRIYE